MKTVSAAFSAAIAEGCVRICELYDFALTNGTTVRITDHDRDKTWNAAGDTYTALPIGRGPIRFDTDGQVEECQVDISKISGDLADIVADNGLEGCELTIKKIRWDADYAADEEIQIFVGTPDVGYNSMEMSLNFTSIFGSLNIMVPAHMLQDPCNYAVFDETCGLTQADYAYSGTATGGTQVSLIDTTAGTLYKVDFDAGDSDNPIEMGDAITGQDGGGTAVVVQIIFLTATTGTLWYLEQAGAQFVDDEEIQNGDTDSIVCNGTPAEDQTFYRGGELEITSGTNNGQRRKIENRSGSTITPCWPLIAAAGAGVTYKIYPGCDGSTETCHYRFNNADEWNGYPYIPPIEEVLYA